MENRIKYILRAAQSIHLPWTIILQKQESRLGTRTMATCSVNIFEGSMNLINTLDYNIY